MLRRSGNFLDMDRPKHHSIEIMRRTELRKDVELISALNPEFVWTESESEGGGWGGGGGERDREREREKTET